MIEEGMKIQLVRNCGILTPEIRRVNLTGIKNGGLGGGSISNSEN
jgi:hypothetical protein